MKRQPKPVEKVASSSRYGVDAGVRDQWLRVVDELHAIPAPEPGSTLRQLATGDSAPGLIEALTFLSRQGSACLCAALNDMDCGRCVADLTPIAPLARSALLCFSKVVAVCAPLCLEVRELGPGRQLVHDNLVNTFLDHDRRIEMGSYASEDEAELWESKGRSALQGHINGLRSVLSQKPIPEERRPRPSDIQVGEGVWIWDAQRKSASLRQLVGAPKEEFEQRMQWAWHQASVVTHGGMTTLHADDSSGLRATFLPPSDASDILRTAVEMGVSARHVLWGTSAANAAPPSFAWNSDGQLPRSIPKT